MPRSQLGWLSVQQSTANTNCQTLSGQISGDRLEQGIDGCGGKDFEKRKVLTLQRAEVSTGYTLPSRSKLQF